MSEDEFKRLLDSQDWKEIAKGLTLYAHSRLKFWGLLTERGIRGYSPKDIALEAISLVYAGDRKWNPDKSDLLSFLKFNVVNSLISNLARNKEVRSFVDNENADADSGFNTEDEVNAKIVVEEIRKMLSNDQMLLNIFDDLFSGLKRQGICEHLLIDPGDYDNAVRRLKTKMFRYRKLMLLK